MEDKKKIEARRSRRSWLTLGGVIAVVFAAIGILIFTDDAPPDDAWLLPRIKPESAEKNPLVIFCETISGHPLKGDYVVFKRPNEFKKIPSEDMRAFVDKHALQAGAFDRLMRTDPATWGWPDQGRYLYEDLSFPYLGPCNQIAGILIRVRIELLMRAGKINEAVSEALATVRFGHGISRLEGLVFPWVVGMEGFNAGHKELRSALTMPGVGEEILRRAQGELEPLDLRVDQFQRILGWEYLSFKNMLNMVRNGDVLLAELRQKSPITFGLFLRQNRTLSNYVALARPLDQAAGKDWPALLAVAEATQRDLENWHGSWSFRNNPNVGGNMLLSMQSPSMDSLVERGARASALHRQAVIMIALRRRELAEGSLPGRLDDLVPNYLSAVPLDPFDNAPMRWNSGTQVLYSIGQNLIDDHGRASDSYERSDKDVGMRYWWKPKGP